MGHEYDELLRSLMEGTASAIGADFFSSLVKHLASALRVRCALVAECVEPDRTSVRTLAFWIGSSEGDSLEYALSGTPCEAVVLGGELRCYPLGVRSLFPTDSCLTDLDAESYMGTPLLNSQRVVLGHLAILDDRPLCDRGRKEAILRVFAARAAAEMERRRIERAREALLVELQQALARVRTLRGLLPVCAWCRRIRDDQGYWSQLEAYVRDHTDADFTHGICPECAEKVRREDANES